MTDPAGITQRGAEQSAPRSRSGLSASDSQGVSRFRTQIVSSHPSEQTVLALYRQPPGAGRQLERRLAVAKGSAQDLPPIGAPSAVEGRSEARARLGVSLRRIGRVGAQLRAKRGDAPAGAVACLTSAGRDGDARHVRIVPFPVLRAAAIAAGEAPRLPIERVACSLKCGVE
jgi:hypothetical protein